MEHYLAIKRNEVLLNTCYNMFDHDALIWNVQKRQIRRLESRLVWPGARGENGESLTQGITLEWRKHLKTRLWSRLYNSELTKNRGIQHLMQVNWMVYERYAQISWAGNALEDEEGRAFHLVVWGALGTQNSAGDEASMYLLTRVFEP